MTQPSDNARRTEAAAKLPPIDVDVTDFRFRSTRQDGAPLRTKAGDPFWIVDIQIGARPGVWINGLVFREPDKDEWLGQKRSLILYTENRNNEVIAKFRLPPSDDRKPRPKPMTEEQGEKIIALLDDIAATTRELLMLKQAEFTNR